MQTYSTDVDQTAAEVFDGELVIAHYGSGLYYAVSPAGALIWQGLRHGLTEPGVVAWLAGAFPAQADEIAAMVRDFIGALAAEALIVPAERPVPGPDLPALQGGTLEAPSFERFEDLQDLLLLDPVHDVEDAGWPHRADA